MALDHLDLELDIDSFGESPLTLVPTEEVVDNKETVIHLLSPDSIEAEVRRIEVERKEEAKGKRRSGFLMFGLAGGGVLFGGVAASAVFAMLAAGTLGLAALGGGAYYLSTLDFEAAPVAAPVVEDVADDAAEAPVADEEPAEAPIADEPTAEQPVEDAPEADEPAPVEPPVAAPATSAPPAAPEAAPPTMMTVKFISDPPAASVFLDGQNIGRTPLKATIASGAHAVRIDSGKASGTWNVNAAAGSDRFCFAAKGRKINQSACN